MATTLPKGYNVFRIGLFFIVALSLAFASLACASTNSQGILQLASNPTFEDCFAWTPGNILAGVGNEYPNGAVDTNTETGYYDITSQRWAGYFVEEGVVTGNNADLQEGMAILNYGFSFEQSDGSFPNSDFQDTSLWLEGAANAILALQESGNPSYNSYIAQAIPKLELTAKWLSSPTELTDATNAAETFTHRWYLLAAAFEETSALSGDSSLQTLATQLATTGLTKQWSDGTNPEEGGWDINYQAAGLYWGSHYYEVCPSSSLQSQLATMLYSGANREMEAISQDGMLNLDGSTRTGIDPVTTGSGVKGFDQRGIISALLSSGQITNTSSFEAAAYNIACYYWWNAATMLTVTSPTGSPGQSVTLSATLTAAPAGFAISGKTINFTVDGSSAGSALTNSSGVVSCQYTIPSTFLVGANPITATFPVSSTWNGSSATGTLTNSIGTPSIVAAPATVADGQQAAFIATLSAAVGGTPVTGQTVVFALNNTILGTATTNGSGVATYVTTVGNGNGNWSSQWYSATFGGSASFTQAAIAAAITVTNIPCSLVVAPTSGTPGTPVTLSATLAAPGGYLLPNRVVTFSIDGVVVGSGTTNSSGFAQFTYVAPSSMSPTSHAVAASYNGDAHYLTVTGTSTLNL